MSQMIRTAKPVTGLPWGVTDLGWDPKNDEEEKSGAIGTGYRTCLFRIQYCRIDHCAGGNDDWNSLREISQYRHLMRKNVNPLSF
jgi:hypothetical protein